MALWSVEFPQRIFLPLGPETPVVDMVDFMGGRKTVKAQNGGVELELTTSPIYLRRLPGKLYAQGIKSDRIIASSFPGQKLPLPAVTGEFVPTAGISLANGQITLPQTLTPGIYPVTASNWLLIKPPLEISSVSSACSNGNPGLKIAVKNHGGISQDAVITVLSAAAGEQKITARIEPDGQTTKFIPVKDSGTGQTHRFIIALNTANNPAGIRIERKVNFLAAHRRGAPADPDLLTNTITWADTGSSGKKQTAVAVFEWDMQNLYLTVRTDDDRHTPAGENATIWQGDSLQVAFDTHPDKDEVYEPLAGIFTKKLSTIAVARNLQGKITVWRHDTPNQRELPSGDISNKISAEVTRTDSPAATVYRLAIPWAEIGLDKVVSGQSVGLDLLVNDKDDNGPRCGLGLFGGIMADRHYSRYGRIILQ